MERGGVCVCCAWITIKAGAAALSVYVVIVSSSGLMVRSPWMTRVV